jgi:hypothetical protein
VHILLLLLLLLLLRQERLCQGRSRCHRSS